MTREKSIFRTCEKCNILKKTTVHLEEEAVYFCEDCKKIAGIKVLLGYQPLSYKPKEKQPNPMKGLVIALIIFIIGFLIGKFMF